MDPLGWVFCAMGSMENRLGTSLLMECKCSLFFNKNVSMNDLTEGCSHSVESRWFHLISSLDGDFVNLHHKEVTLLIEASVVLAASMNFASSMGFSDLCPVVCLRVSLESPGDCGKPDLFYIDGIAKNWVGEVVYPLLSAVLWVDVLLLAGVRNDDGSVILFTDLGVCRGLSLSFQGFLVWDCEFHFYGQDLYVKLRTEVLNARDAENGQEVLLLCIARIMNEAVAEGDKLFDGLSVRGSNSSGIMMNQHSVIYFVKQGDEEHSFILMLHGSGHGGVFQRIALNASYVWVSISTSAWEASYDVGSYVDSPMLDLRISERLKGVVLKALYAGMDLDLFERQAHSVVVLLGLMDCSLQTLRLDPLSIGYLRWVSPVLSRDEWDEWNGGFVSAFDKENCNSLESLEILLLLTSLRVRSFGFQNVDVERLMLSNILATHGLLGTDSLFLYGATFNSKMRFSKRYGTGIHFVGDIGIIVVAHPVVVISHCSEVTVLVYYGKGCNCIMNIGLFQPLLEGSLHGGIYEIEEFFAVCYLTREEILVLPGHILNTSKGISGSDCDDALMTSLAGVGLTMRDILGYWQLLFLEQGSDFLVLGFVEQHCIIGDGHGMFIWLVILGNVSGKNVFFEHIFHVEDNCNENAILVLCAVIKIAVLKARGTVRFGTSMRFEMSLWGCSKIRQHERAADVSVLGVQLIDACYDDFLLGSLVVDFLWIMSDKGNAVGCWDSYLIEFVTIFNQPRWVDMDPYWVICILSVNDPSKGLFTDGGAHVCYTRARWVLLFFEPGIDPFRSFN